MCSHPSGETWVRCGRGSSGTAERVILCAEASSEWTNATNVAVRRKRWQPCDRGDFGFLRKARQGCNSRQRDRGGRWHGDAEATDGVQPLERTHPTPGHSPPSRHPSAASRVMSCALQTDRLVLGGAPQRRPGREPRRHSKSAHKTLPGTALTAVGRRIRPLRPACFVNGRLDTADVLLVRSASVPRPTPASMKPNGIVPSSGSVLLVPLAGDHRPHHLRIVPGNAGKAERRNGERATDEPGCSATHVEPKQPPATTT